MSALDVLKDPRCSITSAVRAAKKLFGASVIEWEPDTIRLSLAPRLGEVSDGLVAKLLAGFTAIQGNAWSYDHEVFFAFALACCGVPADGETVAHPTPEQLCWAVDEIQALLLKPITVDEGFDPQTVDPAIASVLWDDGYVVAPDLLHFVQEELEAMDYGDSAALRKRVQNTWALLRDASEEGLRQGVTSIRDESVQVQIGRLADCDLYVRERRLIRSRHHAELERT